MRSLFMVFLMLFAFEFVLAVDQVKLAPVVVSAPAINPPIIPVNPPVADQVAEIQKAPSPVMVKDESAAPPEWVQNMMVTIKALPVIGPVAVKVLNWIAVVVSIMSALTAFLLIATKALSSVLNIAQLTDLAGKIQSFQSGKIMYYLKYASMFNAQKPVAAAAPEAPKAQA